MKQFKPNHVATVVAATAFMIFVLVGVMFFSRIWTTAGTYNVSAYVTNARGIAQDSTVFEAGLPVGLVTGIRRNGPDAMISLRIDQGPTPLPADTTIRLGLRSLAGEADVQLYPGHSTRTIRDGGSLSLTQDQDYTEVDQILNQLAGPTEGNVRKLVQGLGLAVAHQGPNLNQTLGATAELINQSPPLTSTLAVQHQQVADIVQNLGNIMGAIGQRSQAIRDFAHGSLTTFNAVAARDRALRDTINELPDILNAIHAAASAVQTTSPHISPVLTNLAGAVTNLKPTIDLLTPASTHGIKLVRALGDASAALQSVLRNLEQAQPTASRALPAVHALTCQLNPMLRFLAPYDKDIGAFFDNWTAVMDPYLYFHEMYGSIHVNAATEFRGVQSPPVTTALQTLINSGVFGKASTGDGFDPLRPPGGIDRHDIGVGLSTPAQFGATHKYPHVTADCSR